MAEQEQEQAPPPTSPERAGTAFNTDQPSSLEQPLTPVHSSGCLLDTAFALCGVSVGSVGGGGSTCSSGSAEKNTTAENKTKENMSRSSGSGEMNGSNNTNNTNANNLTGSVAGMSLLDKDASAKADNGDGNNDTSKAAAAGSTSDCASDTGKSTKTSNGTAKEFRWDADRVDFARRCTLPRCDDDVTNDNNVDGDGNDSSEAASTCSSTPSKSNPAAPPANPTTNTKVKRKSSTLGGLTSSFGSRRSSSSATTSTTPQKKKELPGQPIPSTSWGISSATKFHVRSGPNYAKNGLKKPSLDSLYEVVAVRMFTSGKKTTGGMAKTLPVPMEEIMMGGGGGNADADDADADTNTNKLWSDMGGDIDPSIPDVLIFHVQMPHDAPSMFKAAEDGPGEEAVVYLRPSSRFISEITGQTPMTSATQLFVRWCQTADKDLSMRSRFKCMALVRNLEAHNLGWVSPYNGKPVLITESGHCRKGILKGTGVGGVGNGVGSKVRYLEMTADVFRWGFLAKKGFVTLLPKFKELRLDIGFTIEGKSDDELPECMLGSFVANFCDEGRLEKIPTEMQRPV